jgi:hypothetical protein
MKLAYCDLIAHLIRKYLNSDENNIKVEKVNWDLHPTEGYFISTKKTLDVIDFNGKQYKITVEEI